MLCGVWQSKRLHALRKLQMCHWQLMQHSARTLLHSAVRRGNVQDAIPEETGEEGEDGLASPKFSPFAEMLEGGSATDDFKEDMQDDSRDLQHAILAPAMAKPGCVPAPSSCGKAWHRLSDRAWLHIVLILRTHSAPDRIHNAAAAWTKARV